MLDRLPFEIFRWIIKSSNKHSSITDIAGEVSLPPIKASHVCRSWRIVLLSDPTMWTCFLFRSKGKDKGQTKEFLRRSGSASLDVFVLTVGWELDNRALALVLREVYRIRRLEVSAFMKNIKMKRLVNRIAQHLQRPAPRLKYLLFGFGAEYDSEVGKEFPQILSPGNMPNLKHLYLELSAGRERLFAPPLFQNLHAIELSMTFGTVELGNPITFIHGDTFLDLLELSPQLRLLTLSPTHLTQPITSPMILGRRVHLPHLKRLDLRGLFSVGVSMADFLFRHLIFPFENINSHIQCNDLHHKKFNPESARLLHFLAQRHHTSLSILINRDSMSLEFKDHLVSSSVFQTKYDETHEPADNLPGFLQIFKLVDITRLSLKNGPIKSALLRNVFALLVNLVELCVDDGFCHYFKTNPDDFPSSACLLALMPYTSNVPSPTQNGFYYRTINVLCPSLRLLKMDLKELPSKLKEPCIRQAVACAEFRRRAGHPFQAVTIHCVSGKQQTVDTSHHAYLPILIFRDHFTG